MEDRSSEDQRNRVRGIQQSRWRSEISANGEWWLRDRAGKAGCNGQQLRRTDLERPIRRGCSPGTKPTRNSPAGVSARAHALIPRHHVTALELANLPPFIRH